MACYQTVTYPVPEGAGDWERAAVHWANVHYENNRCQHVANAIHPSIHHLPCPFLIWGRNNGLGGLFRITAIHLGPKQHWQLFTTLALQLGWADRVSLRCITTRATHHFLWYFKRQFPQMIKEFRIDMVRAFTFILELYENKDGT